MNEQPIALPRAIPATRLSRFNQLASMTARVGGNMAGGALQDLARGQRPKMRDLLLTPGNMRRIADDLAKMRGAAMKIGQLVSMDTGDVLARGGGERTLSEVVLPASLGTARLPLLRLSAVIICFCFLFYIAAQFDGAGKAFAANFGWSQEASVLIGAGIVMLYTLVGGFWAVSVTDALQALAMMLVAVVLPVVAVAAVSATPAGWDAALSATIVSTDGEPNTRPEGGGRRDLGRDSYTLSGKGSVEVAPGFTLRAVGRYVLTEGDFNDQDIGFGRPKEGQVLDSQGTSYQNEEISGLIEAR